MAVEVRLAARGPVNCWDLLKALAQRYIAGMGCNMLLIHHCMHSGSERAYMAAGMHLTTQKPLDPLEHHEL